MEKKHNRKELGKSWSMWLKKQQMITMFLMKLTSQRLHHFCSFEIWLLYVCCLVVVFYAAVTYSTHRTAADRNNELAFPLWKMLNILFSINTFQLSGPTMVEELSASLPLFKKLPLTHFKHLLLFSLWIKAASIWLNVKSVFVNSGDPLIFNT